MIMNMERKASLNLMTISLIIGFWLFSVGTKAQQIDPEYISVANGLVSATVNDVLQDSYGLIWIATANGLQKYDGYTFETFKNIPGKTTSLQDNYIWSIMEDTNHDLWIGNGRGASKYNRKTNTFKNYDFAEAFNFVSDARVSGFKFLRDSQNRLWINSIQLQLLQYDSVGDQWKRAEYQIPDIENPIHVGFSKEVVEDSKGNLWSGSISYGLMRQKKGESAFKPIPAEKIAGIDFVEAENAITALYADSTNTLWITTRSGVYKYNPETGALKTIQEYIDVPTIPWLNWNSILPDGEGNIWIANNFRGILKFKGISDEFEEIEIAGKERVSQRGWNITLTQFMIDRSGIFWFGSREFGLLKYDPIKKPFSHLAHDADDPNSLSAGGVFGILASQVNPGMIYVGTRGSGLNIYDSKKGTFDKVNFNAQDDFFGVSGSVRSIAEDEDGSLWLGSWGDGLVELDENKVEVKKYKYDSLSNASLSGNQVRVIKHDNQGRLWIGTNNGLNILNIEKSTIKRIESKYTVKYPRKLIAELERLIDTDQKIGAIENVTDFQDLSLPVEIKTTGTYWVMAAGEGDINSMADFGWIENEKQDTVWQMGDYANTYHAGGASKNRIDIRSVTLEPGNYTLRFQADDSHAYGKWNEAAPDQTSLYGMVLYKPQTMDQLQSFQPKVDPENSEMIVEDSNITDIEVTTDFVWIGYAGGGLDRIDPVTSSVKHYGYDLENENSLSSNTISDIYEDKHGILWLATNEGINKFNPTTETFIRYSEADGLPTNLAEVIVEGDDGEMWIATQNGLSQMVTNENLDKVTFINYNSSDGLGGDVFLSLASARATDGQFYFGGDHGLTTFKIVNSNKTPPAVIISDLFISNKSVLDMENDSPLTKNLLDTESISLTFDKNSLSFEFAALHYANPQKNQYAHMLKGYDAEWIYDNRNFAGYTNLAPGKYEFLVRASNAYGLWNEEGVSLEIIILPPWWRTWWAYAFYIIVFSFFAFITDRAVRKRIRMRERERGRERELKQAKEIEKAYNELKATQSQLIQAEKMASLGELTAGIAHEIQNPLNFVNNFAEVNKELIEEVEEELGKGNVSEVELLLKDIKGNEEKISHHGKRADAIVKGMLEHSRTSTTEKELTKINLLADEFFRLSYHGLRAKDKTFNAKLVTDFDDAIGKVNINRQDIGRVVLNLINNAFYTVNEKKKSSSAEASGDTYEPTVSVSTKKISASDSGQGVESIQISVKDNGNGIPYSIKEKIFQPFFTTKPTGSGTGLGLSLSYDIVKAHGGDIKIETKENDGTEFIITLPVQ